MKMTTGKRHANRLQLVTFDSKTTVDPWSGQVKGRRRLKRNPENDPSRVLATTVLGAGRRRQRAVATPVEHETPVPPSPQ